MNQLLSDVIPSSTVNLPWRVVFVARRTLDEPVPRLVSLPCFDRAFYSLIVCEDREDKIISQRDSGVWT